MEEYGLDMAPCWADWESKLGDGLARLKGKAVDEVHFHFLQVFTWFFFPVASGRCLEEYRRFNPAAADGSRCADQRKRPGYNGQVRWGVGRTCNVLRNRGTEEDPA